MANFLQVLTPHEIEDYTRILEEWWASLDLNTKSSVRALLEAFEQHIAPEQYRETLRKRWEKTLADHPEWQNHTVVSNIQDIALLTDHE